HATNAFAVMATQNDTSRNVNNSSAFRRHRERERTRTINVSRIARSKLTASRVWKSLGDVQPVSPDRTHVRNQMRSQNERVGSPCQCYALAFHGHGEWPTSQVQMDQLLSVAFFCSPFLHNVRGLVRERVRLMVSRPKR